MVVTYNSSIQSLLNTSIWHFPEPLHLCFPRTFSLSGSHPVVLPDSVQWSPLGKCFPSGRVPPFPVCAAILPRTIALTVIVQVPTHSLEDRDWVWLFISSVPCTGPVGTYSTNTCGLQMNNVIFFACSEYVCH